MKKIILTVSTVSILFSSDSLVEFQKGGLIKSSEINGNFNFLQKGISNLENNFSELDRNTSERLSTLYSENRDLNFSISNLENNVSNTFSDIKYDISNLGNNFSKLDRNTSEQISYLYSENRDLRDKIYSLEANLTYILSLLNLGETNSSDDETNSLDDRNLSRAFLNIPQSFSRSGDVVTDNVSGLKWEDTTHTKTFELTFSSAENYCSNLELGGITDWRVPTNKELWYLYDRSKYDPALNSTFQNVESAYSDYWSNQAVTKSGFESSNWILYSSNGEDGWRNRTDSSYIRCVSGESSYEEIEFERDNSLEVVKDKTNGLMWQDQTSSSAMNYDSAVLYCQNLSYANYFDWRLPRVEELYSITDQRKSSSPFANSEFKNIESNWYWSATEDVKYSSFSWIVGFNDGLDDWYNHYYSLHVVCVRDL